MSIFHIDQSAARQKCIDIVEAHIKERPTIGDTLDQLEAEMVPMGLGGEELRDARLLLMGNNAHRLLKLFNVLGTRRPRAWFVIAKVLVKTLATWAWKFALFVAVLGLAVLVLRFLGVL